MILTSFNVGKYINKSIESVINQDIGFEENVQLIIVDDGSTDNSLDIINEYAEKYPNNIVTLTQKNSGVASSRNLGLIYVEGEYVNFLDGDDFISKNTLSNVYEFFESNKESVDVVSLPLYYFKGKKGAHELNDKVCFRGIVDLKENPNNPLLSINSSFFKSDVLRYEYFDEDLICSEDSLLLNKILLDKNKYGFIGSSRYWYRQRYDLTNISNRLAFEKEYYLDRLRGFYLNLIHYCQDNFNVIPDFIQYNILYSLLDILKREELDFLEIEDEINEFFEILAEILSFIDDEVIVKCEFAKSVINILYCLNNI